MFDTNNTLDELLSLGLKESQRRFKASVFQELRSFMKNLFETTEDIELIRQRTFDYITSIELDIFRR